MNYDQLSNNGLKKYINKLKRKLLKVILKLKLPNI